MSVVETHVSEARHGAPGLWVVGSGGVAWSLSHPSQGREGWGTHFVGGWKEMQVPPLRFASVGMTILSLSKSASVFSLSKSASVGMTILSLSKSAARGDDKSKG